MAGEVERVRCHNAQQARRRAVKRAQVLMRVVLVLMRVVRVLMRVVRVLVRVVRRGVVRAQA